MVAASTAARNVLPTTKMRSIVVALCLLALGACAGKVGPSADPRNAWIGRSLDDLIKRAGIPDREYSLPDGSRLVEFSDTYTRSRIVQVLSAPPPVRSYSAEGKTTSRVDGFGNVVTEQSATIRPERRLNFIDGSGTRVEKSRCGFTTIWVADAQRKIVRWSERNDC
jgi:hypothetical protein